MWFALSSRVTNAHPADIQKEVQRPAHEAGSSVDLKSWYVHSMVDLEQWQMGCVMPPYRTNEAEEESEQHHQKKHTDDEVNTFAIAWREEVKDGPREKDQWVDSSPCYKG